MTYAVFVVGSLVGITLTFLGLVFVLSRIEARDARRRAAAAGGVPAAAAPPASK